MTRTSLTKYAGLMRDEPTLSEHDKRELGRRAWQKYGAIVVLEGWAPKIFWDALCAIARRLYGERGM